MPVKRRFKMKSVLKSVGKVALASLCSILALIMIAWAGLNIAKLMIYQDYYQNKTDIAAIPGLDDDFVCQGICVAEEQGKLLVCGYMTDDTNSRIYVTDENNDSYYVSLTRNGQSYKGHAGGIALSGDTLLISNGSKLYTFPLSSVLSASDGDSVDIGGGTSVNNSASFVFADEEYVYVGEFHDGDQYVKDHPYTTPEGTNHAIVTCYSADNLVSPVRVYSVPDKVQGMCLTDDGKIVFSTSYGLADTVYLIYSINDAYDSGETLDGTPVYYFSPCEREIHGPAMGEDMDFSEGKIITLSENATKKYLFGKFFFGGQIVALDFSGK